MADFPRPTKYSKVGSNLKAHKALAAFDDALVERRIKPFLRAERKFQRQRREILTKPVVRNAAEVFRQHRDAYDRAFLKANGNGVEIVKSRRRARAAIDRALRVTIPRFAKYEALRQQYALDYRGLVAITCSRTRLERSAFSSATCGPTMSYSSPSRRHTSCST
jgi:hypothetical protein